MVRKWLLPTLSEILSKAEPDGIDLRVPETTTNSPIPAASTILERERWQSAIAAANHLLSQVLAIESAADRFAGILLASCPLPKEIDRLADRLAIYPFTSSGSYPQLPAGDGDVRISPCTNNDRSIAILPTDPLAQEQFYLLLTTHFSLLITLGDKGGVDACQFSFDPAEINIAWQSLRGRILLTSPDRLSELDRLLTEFYPIAPDYRWVMAFSRHLFQSIAPAPQVAPEPPAPKSTVDVELLQALTHEIRTPLTTIRTMTRLLLRQPDLSTRTLQRLESIDRECTEQIDRMELIFSAVELASSNSHGVALAKMSLQQLLDESVPVWQQQAQRRNLDLAVDLPQQLPAIVSNHVMLDRILTGLVDNFTRNLPAGSRIQVEVTPVGDKLKLQLQSQLEDAAEDRPTRYSIGQLLTFQPETGNLSLNMNVTKNLFQLLGGKLIVRHNNPDRAEVLTIFLPLSRQ